MPLITSTPYKVVPPISPTLLAFNGTKFSYSDGTTWSGPFTATGTSSQAILVDGTNQWMVFHGNQRSYTNSGQLAFEDFPSDPGFIRLGSYNKNTDTWLFISSTADIFTSTNDGTTWTNTGPAPFTTKNTTVARRAVTINDSGTTTSYFVISETSNNELFIAYTDDDGATWTNSVNVPQSSAPAAASTTFSICWNELEDKFYITARQPTYRVFSIDRSDLQSSGSPSPWSIEGIDYFTGPPLRHIDCNPTTGTVMTVAPRNVGLGTKTTVARKPLSGSPLTGVWSWIVIFATANTAPFSIVYDPTTDKWYVTIVDGASTRLIVSSDDGLTWAEDVTFPALTGNILEHVTRYTMNNL